MIKDDQYWEKIVDLLDSARTESGMSPEEKEDFRGLVNIREKLEQVFRGSLFNKEEAKKKFRKKIDAQKRKALYLVFIRAAVILIAVLSGFMVHSLLTYQHKDKFTEITVPPGQMTLVKLPDGTEVCLNSGTKLKYPDSFKSAPREVFLDGEAYFSVSPDKKHPFTVFTNNLSLTVLGTSFNVDAYSAGTKTSVTLVEGSVMLNDHKGVWKKILQPGQMATIDNSDKKTPQISDTNTDFYTSWREGKVVFKAETFREIANKLERWYNVEIHFENPELEELRFSGTFLKYKPVEQVLSSICIMNPSVKFKMEDRTEKKNRILVFWR